MTKLKKLPIGIQTFSEICEENYLYVDKTGLIAELVENGKYYFLSRPRRFGKSLLVSTMQALFGGHKELFNGLAIYERWDWSVKYPVIKISFGGVARNREEMKQDVTNILEENQRRLGIVCSRPDDIGGCFKQLITQVYEKYGQKVVVLVDEYDKLIVDNLDQLEVAGEGREILRDLYTTIKDSDEYIKFAFLTGVSRFSKVSVFSGLNNLKDISFDPRYSTICGYTHNDLETVFADHLQGVDMDKVRQWYNGYNFLGEPVYNPFDILLFVDGGQVYKNYWFGTGTPTFLLKLIRQNNYFVPRLSNLRVSDSLVDSYDLEKIALEPILLQTGYLTIDSRHEARRGGVEYLLKFSNKEVQLSFNDVLIDYFTDQPVDRVRYQNQLYDILDDGAVAALKPFLTTLFAAIPYNNYVNNTIGSYEGYYASVVYAYLASLGFELIPEDVTNKGRIDLTVKVYDYIYILEFKVDDEGQAFKQIRERNYQEKYLHQGKTIYLVGIDFDSAERTISGFEWEKV